MDTEICGLNKVKCKKGATDYKGYTVRITSGSNLWEKILDNNSEATFLIPSMPAPAKQPYVLKVIQITYNTSGEKIETKKYEKEFELGFGDSVIMYLDPNMENPTATDLATVKSRADEAYSKAVSAASSASSAYNKADSAYSLASTANSNASSAKSTANSAYSTASSAASDVSSLKNRVSSLENNSGSSSSYSPSVTTTTVSLNFNNQQNNSASGSAYVGSKAAVGFYCSNSGIGIRSCYVSSGYLNVSAEELPGVSYGTISITVYLLSL